MTDKAVKWHTFIVNYDDSDGKYSFEIQAKDWADAEWRLGCIRATGRVIGQLHSTIDASEDVLDSPLLSKG